MISPIEDEQETTETRETTNDQMSERTDQNTSTIKDDQVTTTIWYNQRPTNAQESNTKHVQLTTKNQETQEPSATPWYHIPSTSSRQWYYPVKLKRQQETTNTQEQETTKNQIPELKVLTPTAISKPSKETNIKITQNKISTQNDQTKTDEHKEQSSKDSAKQRTVNAQELKTAKNSKSTSKIANLTRTMLTLLQSKETKVTDERRIALLEIETYKRNKYSSNSVKPHKNNKHKKMKTTNDQVQQETANTQEQRKSNTTNTRPKTRTRQIEKPPG